MKFEIINDKNKVVMNTTHGYCIPDKDILTSMSKVGYKFKLDDRAITIKKLNEMLKEIKDAEDNKN